jgi:hypothetical protein
LSLGRSARRHTAANDQRRSDDPHDWLIGDFALAHPQAFGFLAGGQEAAKAQFLTALVENSR